MKKVLIAALAASAVLGPTFATPAVARGGMGGAVGKDPKVCLLTFSSAAQYGQDAAVVKAQYVPLRIAQKLLKDTSTQGIAYYGFGDLTTTQQAQIQFYYPNGSSDPAIGVTDTSDTQTLCEAFQQYADSQATSGDDDENESD